MSKNTKVIETKNIEDALQAFVDAYNQMSPGDEITLTIKALPKECVKLHRVKGTEGTSIFDKINEALVANNITKAGYVSMDADFNWYYSVNLPKPQVRLGVHVTDEHVLLFHYEPESLEHTWDKMIKYVS